jgi:hypothetical protein
MRLPLFVLAVLITTSFGRAETNLPAAQLLPTDTLALVSVPDWDQALAYWNQCPQGKLWQDPALKPFRTKVIEKWENEFVAPLEQQLGIHLSDYSELFHGQMTFALTQNGWGTESGDQPGIVLLLDAKDKQAALRLRLIELKKHWIESGKQLKSDKIRGVDFTTLLFTGDDLANILDKILPGSTTPVEAPAGDDSSDLTPKKVNRELIFGQSGSLLIVASSPKVIEKILARQQGALLPALADQAAYQTDHGALFRGALAFVWLNAAAIMDNLQKPKPVAAGQPAQGPRNDRFLNALGLNALRSVVGRLSGSPEGTAAELFVSLPEQQRRGLLSLLAAKRKDAGPPTFVGADVVHFSRWRLDGQKAWTTLENALTVISPEVSGLLQMGLQAAGKDRDPNFDLRQTLTSSLSDDFISIQKNASPNSPVPSSSASLYLVGSPKPDQFIQALKAGSALMPLAGGEPNLQEREFLGHRIYSVGLAGGAIPNSKAEPTQNALNFAAGAGYAAISTDPLLVEEFLRGSEAVGKPLQDLVGLRDAAQKVGGMSALYFSYQNQAETARAWLEGSKRESAALEKILSLAPLKGGKALSQEEKKVTGWFDPALLPPFEKISKYFYFLLYSLSASNDGVSWKFFAPTPPALKFEAAAVLPSGR